MNDKRNIIALNKLAIELDQLGEYRLSEDIDNLIKTAILWNAPKLRRNHPATKELRDNHLEELPPQNILESIYQNLTSQPGKTLPRIRLVSDQDIKWTPQKFFYDIQRDFRTNGRISEDFVNLLLQSSIFSFLLHHYLFVETDDSNLKDSFKQMMEKAEPYLIDKLEKEFRKHKIIAGEGSRDIDFIDVLEKILTLGEILPLEFKSQVEATKEWVEYQRQQEVQAIHDKYDTFRDDHRSPERARKELDEYLQYSSGEPSAIERAQQKRQEETQTLRNSNIINKICKIANTLDNSGYYKEANSLTNIMKRLAEGFVGHPKEFQDRSIEMAGEDKVKEWNEKYTDTTDPMKSKSQVLHDIKATWNQEVDRNFIQSLSFVHFGRASEIDKIMNMTDLELSCIAYKKPPYKNIWWGNAGLLIDGRVTLAGNTDLITNQHVYMSIQTTGKPRKWTNIMDLVLNEDDFVEDQFNEFLLVNWKPIAVIKSYRGNLPLDDKNMTAEQLAEKHNLPLIDENGQRIK
jgi:hypothetical protein